MQIVLKNLFLFLHYIPFIKYKLLKQKGEVAASPIKCVFALLFCVMFISNYENARNG